MVNCESPGRAKAIKAKDFRPFGALAYDNSYQGFAALTPGYCLIAPAGARNRFFLRTVGTAENETASFSRPYGTQLLVFAIPGTEVPG
jgi:hypothetical protein